MNCIRLFSIDDHWAIIKGLSLFRKDRDGVILACSALNMQEALTFQEHEFDIVLLDLILPGTNPVDNFMQLKKKYPTKPIIILTSQENSTWEKKMYELGAKAFVSKLEDKKTLLNIIKKIYQGEDFGHTLLQTINNGLKVKIDRFNTLSRMEQAIIYELYQENNIKTVACRLQKSPFTIYACLAKMRKRLRVNTNLGLLKFLNPNMRDNL